MEEEIKRLDAAVDKFATAMKARLNLELIAAIQKRTEEQCTNLKIQSTK